MVVNWEKVAKATGRFLLLLLEYSIKFSAIIVTAVVLASRGKFGTKLATGFTSISASLRKVFNSPSEIVDRADIVYNYNTLNAASFDEQYGSKAVHEVLSYLQGGIIYLQDVYNNFASQPFATFFASIIACGSLYSISRVIRFSRQKGRGSYLTRLERKLADHVFKHPKELKNGSYKQPSKNRPKPFTKSKITGNSKPAVGKGKTKPVQISKSEPASKPAQTTGQPKKTVSKPKPNPQTPAGSTDKSGKKTPVSKPKAKPASQSNSATEPESAKPKKDKLPNSDSKPATKSKSDAETESKKKKKRVVKPFNAKSQSTNKHLQNFIKSAKKNQAL